MPAKKKFKHGFKAQANRLASEYREELRVPLDAPLCPWKVARHLSIPVLKLSDLPDCDEKFYLMQGKGLKEFSATVCYRGTKAFILNNDAQPIKRQASDIAHEIAHVALGHPPTRPFDEEGNREFLREIEDEAEWLGPAILVSEKAAMRAYRLISTKTYTLESLSDEWQITSEVISMRMNVVGVQKRYRRAA